MTHKSFALHALLILPMLPLLSSCGSAPPTETASTSTATSATDNAAAAVPVSATKLDGVKTYLIDEGDNVLKTNAEQMQAAADKYYDAVKAANFDYRKAWGDGSTLRPLILQMRKNFKDAHTGYESIEGIVAGVPSLSNFDTILDAGTPGDKGGDSVADYSIPLPDGKTLNKPGNHFHNLLEPMIFGSGQGHLALSGVDVDGDGKIGFGDALPEANALKGTADSFVTYVNKTMTAVKAWQPSEKDAFTAMVTMTPTMDEYFKNWKESRFVTGATSTEPAFVAKSRLVDVTQILGSLNTIYGGVRPAVEAKDPAAAAQISHNYTNLAAYVQQILDQERSGKKYTPDQADVIGATAQSQAQAITGQVAQAAVLLNIKVEA